MKLNKQEKKILRGLAAKFRKELNAKQILLYGSAARDQLEVGSDIDLLIVLPVVNWEIEKRVSDLCFDAELDCARVVSTVCLTEDEINNSPLRVSPFILNTKKDGINL
jgi:predicted nucleotidyltransferase